MKLINIVLSILIGIGLCIILNTWIIVGSIYAWKVIFPTWLSLLVISNFTISSFITEHIAERFYKWFKSHIK